MLQWWARDPAEARRRCQEALAVFHVLDNERWLKELEQVPLEPAEMAGVKQSLVEILFLLANVEARFSDGASGTRRAIALLNQVEALAPNLRALYEYRSRYQTILGDQEAARSDSQRAETMQRNTWLDHYFRAVELRGDEVRRGTSRNRGCHDLSTWTTTGLGTSGVSFRGDWAATIGAMWGIEHLYSPSARGSVRLDIAGTRWHQASGKASPIFPGPWS